MSMPKQPDFDGQARVAPPAGRRTTVQVLTGLLLLALPTWALVAAAEAPAGAVPSRPSTSQNTAPAPGMPANSPGQPAGAAAPAPAAAQQAGLTAAYGMAVALQGAVVVQDWLAASRALDALKAIKTEAPRTALERRYLAAATPLMDGLDASIKARNARVANEQAYHLASSLMLALDARAPLASIGGGGGGQAPAAAPVKPSPALEHLRQASDEAAQAQVALINRDTKAAKTHLDAVREHFKGASAATSSPRLKGWIDGMDKQRWRVVAALADPLKAYRNGTILSRDLMRTLRWEGRRAARATGAPAGGGGGGRVKPKPVLQDVPVPTHANAPRRGPTKQMALETVPYDKRDLR
jgi:hypothetical protein